MAENRFDPNARSESGFALVAVIIFMLLVASILTPLTLTAQTRLMMVRNEVQQTRLILLAEGLTNVLALDLAAGKIPKSIPFDFRPLACFTDELKIVIRVQAHTGLIDLNAANHDLLSKGFRSLGFENAESDRLAGMVEYVRSGSGVFDFVTKGDDPLPTGLRFGPFTSVAELQELPPLRSRSLSEVSEVFSIHTQLSNIDRNHAPLRLAGVLGKAGAKRHLSQPAGADAYTLEITIYRMQSRVVGRAGFVVSLDSHLKIGFRRVQVSPSSLELSFDSPAEVVLCDELFGVSISDTLRNWG